MDNPNTDPVAAGVEKLKEAMDTPEDAETVADTPSPEVPKEEPKAEEEIPEENDSHADEATKLIDRITGIDDKEVQLQRIEKLERSGRTNYIEVAQTLREMLGLEKPNEENPDLDALVDKRLKELGINSETLMEQKIEQESAARFKAVKAALIDRGLDASLASEIVNSKEFIVSYHDKKYETLTVKERAELALSRSYKKKPLTENVVGTPKVGDAPKKASLMDLPLEERLKAMSTMSANDF